MTSLQGVLAGFRHYKWGALMNNENIKDNIKNVQEIHETSGSVVYDTQEPNDETKYIFRPYRTLPDGRVIWARQYGKKAFKIPVA